MYYFHRAVDGGFWHNFGHASGGTLRNRQPKQFGTFLTHNRPNAKRADVGLGAEKEFPVELIYHFRRAATSQ